MPTKKTGTKRKAASDSSDGDGGATKRPAGTASASTNANTNTRSSSTGSTTGARKRTQNRIAQQCLRERRAASNRHLDAVFETMRFAAEADQSQRYAMLLDAHIKLARENQLLEDALFRLRKKLLSLSNAAALAADDAVYDMILGRESRPAGGTAAGQAAGGQPSTRAVVVEAAAEGTGDDGSAAVVAQQPSVASSCGTSPSDHGTAYAHTLCPADLDFALQGGSGSGRNLHLDAMTAAALDDGQPDAPPTPPPVLQAVPTSPSSLFLYPDDLELQAPGDALFFSDAEMDMRLDLVDLATAAALPGGLPAEASTADQQAQQPLPQHQEQQQQQLLLLPSPSPWDICAYAPAQTLAVRSGSVFSTKVLQAAMRCIARAQQHAGAAQPGQADVVVQQVAVAAVNLVARGSGMEEYLYGMNGAPYMERVMYWRLATGARALVPSPFRPTPLQCGAGGVPNPTIDFINWPELRDQLLLAGSAVDLDALCRDIVLNTVIEMPRQKVAINVFRQFQRYGSGSGSGGNGGGGGGGGGASDRKSSPTTTDPTPSCCIDPGWVFFEIRRDDPDFQPWAADPVEEALVRVLWRWVQRFNSRYGPRGLSLCADGNDGGGEAGGPAPGEATVATGAAAAAAARQAPRPTTGAAAVAVPDAADAVVSPLGLLDAKYGCERSEACRAFTNTRAWKLSKAFAAKYPFFDCSSATTAYETYEHDVYPALATA